MPKGDPGAKSVVADPVAAVSSNSLASLDWMPPPGGWANSEFSTEVPFFAFTWLRCTSFGTEMLRWVGGSQILSLLSWVRVLQVPKLDIILYLRLRPKPILLNLWVHCVEKMQRRRKTIIHALLCLTGQK